MTTPKTKRWSFISAKTDFKILDVLATQHVEIIYVKCTCAHSNSLDVSVDIGLSSGTTLPTRVDDGATGENQVFVSHGGVAPGGGEVSAMGGEPIAYGNLDEDVLLTCSAPTGGSLRVVMTYRLVDH